jgi:hypothetical protein
MVRCAGKPENRSGLSKVALGEIIIASGFDNNPAYREV